MKLKSFATAAAIAAGITAIAIGLAGPAAADPSAVTTLAGAGSDTTQDVLNAIATNIGPSTGTKLVGSWDATPVHTDITPKSTAACTNITRPNGSGEGVNALRRSLSATSTAAGLTHPVPLGSGCFDFARSSSGPGANQSN